MKPNRFALTKTHLQVRLSRLGYLWLVVLVALTFLLLASDFLSDRVSLQEGDLAPDNVYYFGTAKTYVSQAYTAQAQNLAASAVEQIYKYDETVSVDMQRQVDELFDKYFLFLHLEIAYKLELKKYLNVQALFELTLNLLHFVISV